MPPRWAASELQPACCKERERESRHFPLQRSRRSRSTSVFWFGSDESFWSKPFRHPCSLCFGLHHTDSSGCTNRSTFGCTELEVVLQACFQCALPSGEHSAHSNSTKIHRNFLYPQSTTRMAGTQLQLLPSTDVFLLCLLLVNAESAPEERWGGPSGHRQYTRASGSNNSKGAPERNMRNFITWETAK